MRQRARYDNGAGGVMAEPSLAKIATVLFVVAAAGGVIMYLNYHWKLIRLPKWLVVVHTGIAVVGFLLLLRAAWSTHV